MATPGSRQPPAAARALTAAPCAAPQAIVDGPPGEAEADIQRALFVGDYAKAVEACLAVSPPPFPPALPALGCGQCVAGRCVSP